MFLTGNNWQEKISYVIQRTEQKSVLFTFSLGNKKCIHSSLPAEPREVRSCLNFPLATGYISCAFPFLLFIVYQVLWGPSLMCLSFVLLAQCEAVHIICPLLLAASKEPDAEERGTPPSPSASLTSFDHWIFNTRRMHDSALFNESHNHTLKQPRETGNYFSVNTGENIFSLSQAAEFGCLFIATHVHFIYLNVISCKLWTYVLGRKKCLWKNVWTISS